LAAPSYGIAAHGASMRRHLAVADAPDMLGSANEARRTEGTMKGIAALLALLGMASGAQAATKIVIGTVPNIGDGPLICAIERGYFKEQDIEVDLSPFVTLSKMTPLIVRGDLAMIGGGLSVSFFNSIAQGMPLRYFANRARAPVYHSLVLRNGLDASVKSIKDLKGLKIGTTAKGGLSEYELGKTLESAGLTLDDVDTKPLGNPASVAAIKTGAIDAAVFIPPFDSAAIKDGGVRLLDVDAAVKPRMEVSGLIYNVDWAKKNAELLDRFALAYIRGARCYYEAARGGANRDEMVDYFVKYSPVKDRAIFANMRWSEIDPDGRIQVDSLLDQQDFYARRGYLTKKSPVEAIVDEGPVARALAKLGAYSK
jgi:NitT/TauT family transport system substrate-binding protein